MNGEINITEKYERNGWPSIARPDLKPPDGWSLSLITAVHRVRNHALSPDGERIAFIWDREDLSDVYCMSSAGGWPGRISTNRSLVAFWDDELPRWSPDSRRLAFTLEDHVHVVRADGGLPRKISDFAPKASSPMWMPDSQRLIVTVERHEAEQLVLTDREGTWPRALTDDPNGDAWDAQPAADGLMVAYVYRPFDDLNRSDIRAVDLGSGVTRTITGSPQEFNHTPRWSPLGETIAFLSQRTGFYEIWLVRPDGQEPRQLTQLGMDSDIAWSPDGSTWPVQSTAAGPFELTLVRSVWGCDHAPVWQGITPAQTGRPGDFLTFEYEGSTRHPTCTHEF
jgi:TolB protein